jgi:hypothetical protein
MRRPTPEQFGTTQEDCSLRTSREHTATSILLVAGFVTGWVIGFSITNAVTGLLPGIFVACLFALCTKPILTLYYPRYLGSVRHARAYAAWLAWFEKTQADFWRSLSPLAFEEELAKLYRSLGWNAELTRRSNDKGIDINLRQPGIYAVVQCKQYKKAVGNDAVRELRGAMEAVHAHHAILASPSGFTSVARHDAQTHKIELLDIQGIIALQESVS